MGLSAAVAAAAGSASLAKHPHHHHEHPHHAHGHALLGRNAAMSMAVALTVGYAAVELVTGLWFGSLALVSDAGHMFSDALALGLAWFAAWLSQRPAGARHSFGLARAEVIAAFVNGLAMLLVVVLIAVEAIRRLLASATSRRAGRTGGGVRRAAAEPGGRVHHQPQRAQPEHPRGAAARDFGCHRFGRSAGGGRGDLLHRLEADRSHPVAGDLAADPGLDDPSAARGAARTDGRRACARSDLEEVGQRARRHSGVRSVHDLHVWNISSGRVALSAHLELSSLTHWPQVLADARRILLERFTIEHVTLQPELAGTPEARSAVVKVVARR